MKQLVMSFSIILLFFISDLMIRVSRSFWSYFTLFLIIAGLLFTYTGLHAEQSSPWKFCNMDILIPEDDEDAIDDDEDDWTKSEAHLKLAIKYYERAKQITWFLPEYSDIDKAKLCFSSACAGLAPANAYVKFTAITLNLFVQYGLDCIDRYNEVKYCLHRAAYHIDLHLFYQDLLDQKIKKGYVVIHRHIDEDGNEIP